MAMDRVYFIVQRRGNKPPSLFYSPPGTNANQAWSRAAMWDCVEGGNNPDRVDGEYVQKWKKSMRGVGWRAEKLAVIDEMEGAGHD